MGKIGQDARMDTVKEIRHRNFMQLVREIGEKEIKTLLQMSDAQFRHISGSTRAPSVKERNIGDRLARKIETALNKELGYLDNVHYTDEVEKLAQALKSKYETASDDYKRVINTVIYHVSQEDIGIKTNTNEQSNDLHGKGGKLA